MNTTSSVLIKFSSISFRRIVSPYDENGMKTYIAVINIKDLPPELSNWREINVRDPKSSGVTDKIMQTLQDDPSSFFFRNRGLTIIADKVNFDNLNSILEIEMTDKSRNGLLDGGHTYRVITEYLQQESENKGQNTETEAYIKIEVLEGVKDLQDVVNIVEARNTSTQVKEQSIQELLKKFEDVKKVLSSKSYAEKIAYKEHELLEDGSKKNIDIKDILSYLICFDTEAFDNNSHPTRAYSSKTSTVSYFVDNYERINKYISLLPQILELRDVIYSSLPEAYKETGGKFVGLTGVVTISGRPRMEKIILPFTEKESNYRIPNGFIYPVLAAFRSIVKVVDGKAIWKADPIKFYDQLKFELAKRVCEQAIEFRNPNKLGKDTATWRLCYDHVELESLRRNL